MTTRKAKKPIPAIETHVKPAASPVFLAETLIELDSGQPTERRRPDTTGVRGSLFRTDGAGGAVRPVGTPGGTRRSKLVKIHQHGRLRTRWRP